MSNNNLNIEGLRNLTTKAKEFTIPETADGRAEPTKFMIHPASFDKLHLFDLETGDKFKKMSLLIADSLRIEDAVWKELMIPPGLYPDFMTVIMRVNCFNIAKSKEMSLIKEKMLKVQEAKTA